MEHNYGVIGHYKGEKRMETVIIVSESKKQCTEALKVAEFVPYVIITDKTWQKIQKCKGMKEVFEQVKKMTTNWRVWNKVAIYLYTDYDAWHKLEMWM